MKLKNIFKTLFAISSITVVGLTIGLFVQLIPNSYPNVKVLTKDFYQNWKKDKNVRIDYSSLPTTNHSLSSLLDNPKSVNGGNFAFYFGSQAYAQTNLMLWGLNGTFQQIEGDAPIYTNSLIHKVFDSFWGENTNKLGLDKINFSFFNYIDMVDKKELKDAWNLKMQRAVMGNFVTSNRVKDPHIKDESQGHGQGGNEAIVDANGDGLCDSVDIDGDGFWDHVVDPFRWAVGEGRDTVGVEVIKGVSNFDSEEYSKFVFEPNPDAYYEFRPNAEKDTEYEKIYYRNTPDVHNFLNNFSFIESYLANNYGNSSANKEGMLICFRNLNPNNYESEISNPFDIKVISNVSSSQASLGNTLDSIISFYNPDYDPDANDEEVTPEEPSTPPESTKNKSNKIDIYQRDYKINKLNTFSNYSEYDKNISIIKVKEDIN